MMRSGADRPRTSESESVLAAALFLQSSERNDGPIFELQDTGRSCVPMGLAASATR
ncbi:hypothetical protein SCLCIDRAFT_1208636 [Scleroderma citrinum Foug A]|uniref:Uncharacterized protein n=1 Tax=Scleroderma citrinum Foug A TaxID=1036808 RepID=A0A0C3ELZ4_9AGAM|nr:hypothetical protein SCLCIDRAFT_1208636 [Scleroderma citrinum Foug A]